MPKSATKWTFWRSLSYYILFFRYLSIFENYLNNNIDSLLINQSFNYIMINIIYHHCYTFLLIAIITIAYCYLISCWLKICTSLMSNSAQFFNDWILILFDFFSFLIYRTIIPSVFLLYLSISLKLYLAYPIIN